MRRLTGPLALLFLLIAGLPAIAQPTGFDSYDDWLDEARDDAGLIALGAVVADADGDVLMLAVSGQREKGKSAPVEPEDAWHIGSNTKMLTAALYADLVKRGEARWGATLTELFPDLVETIDPAWGAVTIEDLFAHRSGLPANPPGAWFTTSRFSSATPAAQRADLVKSYLAHPPKHPHGEFLYSNLGYMIAGAAIDRIAARLGKEDYETLLLTDFAQEGGWGFGPPPEGIEGHARTLFAFWQPKGKGPSADNPVALAPAGTLHVPLAVHARFVSRFLSDDPSIGHLLTAYPDATSDYALGWGVYQTEEFGSLYRHTGSNTMWYSMVTLMPEKDLVIIVNTNQYSKAAAEALEDVTGQLARWHTSSQD